MSKRKSPLRHELHGASSPQDRLWRVEGQYRGQPFVAGLTDYNDELTGFAPILRAVFGAQVVCYGGNAYYILNEARKRGFKVDKIEDRR